MCPPLILIGLVSLPVLSFQTNIFSLLSIGSSDSLVILISSSSLLNKVESFFILDIFCCIFASSESISNVDSINTDSTILLTISLNSFMLIFIIFSFFVLLFFSSHALYRAFCNLFLSFGDNIFQPSK